MATNFRSQFPLFTNHPNLVYLDNASTTQTHAAALEAMTAYYTTYRANVHRGIYNIGIKASDAYETARDTLARFINAEREEIIFTPGTTAALNQLAYSFGPRFSHRDNIVLTRLEHHANLVPWQQMAKHYGFEIRFIELTADYTLDLASAQQVIDADTKLVSFSMASNVLGTITPTSELIKLAKEHRAITVIDAAQAAAHLPLDVRALDCDFVTFSGHKMYGPTGIGVLYGKKVMLEEYLEPFYYGGNMVSQTSYSHASWKETPYKFEAGTPNIAGVIGLAEAANFLMHTGWDTIQKHERDITAYALEKLAKEVIIVGPISTQDRIGVISFTVPGVHPHDVAEIANRAQVCMRAGHHCAEPLLNHLNLTSTTRLSIGIYNTTHDIDAALESITAAKHLFAKHSTP